MIRKIEWIECVCERCLRSWIPRVKEPLPIQCASCRRRDWNTSTPASHTSVNKKVENFTESETVDKDFDFGA